MFSQSSKSGFFFKMALRYEKYCVILFKTLQRVLDDKCAVECSGTKCLDQNFLNPDKAISVSSGIVVTSKPYARLFLSQSQ